MYYYRENERSPEDLVKLTEAWLAAIVDNSDDAIISKTLDGIVTTWNGGATRLFGYAAEEMIGCSIARIIPSDLLREETDIIAKLTRGERVDSFETVRLRKSGSRVAISLTVSPIRDASGAIVGASKIARDITDRIRAEEAARAAREAVEKANVDARRLAAIVEGSDDAIIAKTLDGVVTCWNAGAARLFGWRAEEMIGDNIRRIIPLDLVHEEDAILDKLARGERVDHFETTRLAKDGRRVEVSLTASPISDSTGKIIGASKIARDISERKRAAVAMRDAAIVDASDDAIISKTLEGIVKSWNSGATRIFGYAAEEMIGQSVSRLIPFDLQGEEQSIIERLGRGERIDHYETARLTKDGRRIFISLSVSPLRDLAGAIVGASKVARDVTARVVAEQALRKARDEAQAARDAAIEARFEAEMANNAKTEFLAVMSHEIRTPLTSISGFIDLLSHTSGLDTQQRRYVELVKIANEALTTVVDDILDLSKIEQGRLELCVTPFELSSVFHDVIDMISSIARAREIEVRLEIEDDLAGWVVGDRERFRQVLLNLVNNAVKFTERGSVSITARRDPVDGVRERIRVCVRDTGIGIAPDRQSRLFQKFSQADSSVRRRYGGTGLGLAICKRLVELMGGEIGFESQVGEGSTFYFTARLPGAAPSRARAAAGRHSDEFAGRDARILVVDDVAANLEIVKAYLERSGYRVDTIADAREAIRMLERDRYDLVLMDIQMPDMDGVTATRQIRETAVSANNVPIIAMTGNVLPDQVRSFLDAGFNDHVGKPLNRAKLLDRVGFWLPAANKNEQRAGREPPVGKQAVCEDLVGAIGAPAVEKIAAAFLAQMTEAFKSTFERARVEAHALVNLAGLLGLHRLVDACRAVEDVPLDDDERQRSALEALRREQRSARAALTRDIIPRLREERLSSAS